MNRLRYPTHDTIRISIQLSKVPPSSSASSSSPLNARTCICYCFWPIAFLHSHPPTNSGRGGFAWWHGDWQQLRRQKWRTRSSSSGNSAEQSTDSVINQALNNSITQVVAFDHLHLLFRDDATMLALNCVCLMERKHRWTVRFIVD